MLHDLFNKIDPKRAISPVSVADNTALVSQIIDCQGIDSLLFIINCGSIADADTVITALLEHGDDAALSDAAAVPDAQLNGTELLASPIFSDDNKVFKLGYIGNKRYVRLTLTPAANSSAALLSAVALTVPRILPPANPPV